ncbi:hypothetical protein AGMMS50230_09280 [Spirochaetia bacterium]|nr:hypothetical protein AGMMS50230_09280 [Spirochaetia bacterium]
MKKKVQLLRGVVFTTILFAAVLSCGGAGGEYTIGGTGPGGGKIFYVSETGFAVKDKGTYHYLEAAPVDLGKFVWASPQFLPPPEGTGDWLSILDTKETAIGMGYANTAAIRAADPNANPAKGCVDYRGGGKNDWFLPSKDELNQMYKEKAHIDKTANDEYWSSSEYDSSVAVSQNFTTGPQYNSKKDKPCYVRPIRAF